MIPFFCVLVTIGPSHSLLKVCYHKLFDPVQNSIVNDNLLSSHSVAQSMKIGRYLKRYFPVKIPEKVLFKI